MNWEGKNQEEKLHGNWNSNKIVISKGNLEDSQKSTFTGHRPLSFPLRNLVSSNYLYKS